MKKIVFLLLLIFILPSDSSGLTSYLKMRSSHHPGFLRVVMEGPDKLIKKAIVNQKSQSVIITFPDSDFSIHAEKVVMTYRKTGSDAVMLFPGSFRGLKVFTLKYPSRLVVDIYKDRDSSDMIVPDLPLKDRKRRDPYKTRTVIIDPGHGGYESGLVKDKYREKNIALDIAKKLNVLVNRSSSESFLTRGSDRHMDQGERVAFADSKAADIFISLHVGNHSGIVIYVPVVTERYSETEQSYLYRRGQSAYFNETVTLLNAMKEAITADFGSDMVTVRPYHFSFISKVEAAALMIELPSFEDADYIEEFRKEMAGTLYKGLYIYEEIKTK